MIDLSRLKKEVASSPMIPPPQKKTDRPENSVRVCENYTMNMLKKSYFGHESKLVCSVFKIGRISYGYLESFLDNDEESHFQLSQSG